MRFPMAIAHHIAKACGFPSLFVGKYADLEINYIWGICSEDAWQEPIISTFLIGSNKWLRGLNYDWDDHKSSHFVDLSETEDTVLKLLKQHNEFDSGDALDGYILSVVLFEKKVHRIFLIFNPNLGPEESVELEKAFVSIYRLVRSKSEQNQNVVAPSITISKYSGDLLRFIEFTKLFGLSPSFEASNELLAFEYILHVTLNYDPQFVFVKTATNFFGTRFRGHHKGELILNFPQSSVNWGELINEPQIKREEGHDTIVEVVLYLKGETIGTNLKKPTKQEEISSLWRALNPLMERLNKE